MGARGRRINKNQEDSTLRATVAADLGAGGIVAEALPGYEERPAQIQMALDVAAVLESGEHAIIEASTGTGKALSVDTPIPTPTGWKRMGDIVVGDIVFDETGNPTRVAAAFDIMDNRICYEVVFSDGSSLIADAEHEWVSYTHADRVWAAHQRHTVSARKNFVTAGLLETVDQLIAASRSSETISRPEAVAMIGGHQWTVLQAAYETTQVYPGVRPARYSYGHLLAAVRKRLAVDFCQQRRDARPHTTITTEAMAATLTVHSNGRTNHAIAVAGALVLPTADLPVDPYFLGVWLGDGHQRNNHITTADPDLIPEIEKAGYTVRSLKSQPYLYAVDDENGKSVSRWQPGMTGRLRALNVRLNKHIPPIYLRSSQEQRRALLAGLLDTDGTVNRCGGIEFTTTNWRLAQDVHELMCSLGFRPSLREGAATLRGKNCGPEWTLAFTTDQQVFRLRRKIAAHEVRLHNYTSQRNCFRYVIAVRAAPSCPVRCIQVEAPSHLYLAGRAMIPTHNSIAYLIPIVRSGKVSLISTANKALQEQLFYKDIPFVQKFIQPFQAALVKGMGNYLCLDRLEEEIPFQRLVPHPAFAYLEEQLNSSSEWDGDFELLPRTVPSDLRGRIAADSEQCAWRSCPSYGDCYVRKMRQRAEDAQIIVVNHTLLLLDAVMDGFLLPERDVIVIDEAHHLEEEATRAFTVTLTPSRVAALLTQHRLRDHVDQSALQEVLEADSNAWAALERVTRFDAKGRQPLRSPLQEGLRLATTLDTLASSLQLNRPDNLDSKEDQLYDKLVRRTRNLAAEARLVFSYDQPDERVYYIEYIERLSGSGRRASPSLCISAGPLDVTRLLREKLFDKISTIATSATLAVNQDFTFFRSRVGLDAAKEAVLPLSFNYPEQALLYLPRMRLEPTYGSANGPYLQELAGEMRQLVEASRGRAFLLFSSRNALETVYGHLEGALADDYELIVQGRELGRLEMVHRFRERPRAVLFGLKSFWEGVDITGDALSLVVIDKLPFDPPDDPVQEARVNRMKEAGVNWFGDYILPQAILRLKQGIGRLLRTQTDRGVMAILDKRLYTKGYGRQVLQALPPARRTSDIEDVRRFFAAY